MALSFIVPIYGVKENGEPEVLGSSILISVNTDLYLLTATHVFTKNPETSFYLPAKDKGFFLLEATRHSSSPNEDDISIIEINKEMMNKISHFFKPLPSYMICMNDQTSEGNLYSFIGYPQNIQKLEDNTHLSSQFHYIGDACHSSKYRKYNVTEETHIIIKHSKRKGRDLKTGEKKEMPIANCMSGGAILAKKSLVGIILEKKNQLGSIMGIKITPAMEYIRLLKPESSEYIQDSKTLKVRINESNLKDSFR